MRATDLIATAVANGWTDDTAYAPSFAGAMLSRETEDGLLLGITVPKDATAKVQWSVQGATDAIVMRPIRGAAASLGSAILAATSAHSTASATGRLF